MTSHTFECTYQLTGSEFATLHEELKKFGTILKIGLKWHMKTKRQIK